MTGVSKDSSLQNSLIRRLMRRRRQRTNGLDEAGVVGALQILSGGRGVTHSNHTHQEREAVGEVKGNNRIKLIDGNDIQFVVA